MPYDIARAQQLARPFTAMYEGRRNQQASRMNEQNMRIAAQEEQMNALRLEAMQNPQPNPEEERKAAEHKVKMQQDFMEMASGFAGNMITYDDSLNATDLSEEDKDVLKQNRWASYIGQISDTFGVEFGERADQTPGYNRAEVEAWKEQADGSDSPWGKFDRSKYTSESVAQYESSGSASDLRVRDSGDSGQDPMTQLERRQDAILNPDRNPGETALAWAAYDESGVDISQYGIERPEGIPEFDDTPKMTAAQLRDYEDNKAKLNRSAQLSLLGAELAQWDTVGIPGRLSRLKETFVGFIDPEADQPAKALAETVTELKATNWREMVGSGQLSEADYRFINGLIKGEGLGDDPVATRRVLLQLYTTISIKMDRYETALKNEADGFDASELWADPPEATGDVQN